MPSPQFTTTNKEVSPESAMTTRAKRKQLMFHHHRRLPVKNAEPQKSIKPERRQEQIRKQWPAVKKQCTSLCIKADADAVPARRSSGIKRKRTEDDVSGSLSVED